MYYLRFARIGDADEDTFEDSATEASIITTLISPGRVPGGILDLPIDSGSLKVGADAYELPPGDAVIFGWTSETSRTRFATRLKDSWEVHPRIKQQPDSPAEYQLYGSWFHARGNQIDRLTGNRILMYVVACASLPDLPGGPWQRKVPYEDDAETSIRIADLLRKPVH